MKVTIKVTAYRNNNVIVYKAQLMDGPYAGLFSEAANTQDAEANLKEILLNKMREEKEKADLGALTYTKVIDV